MLEHIKFDNFDVQFLGTQHISNIWFSTVDINESDVELSLNDGELSCVIHNMGGRLSAHSAKDGFLFIKGEEFDLDMNVKKGGLEMTLIFGLDKQYVN